MKTYLVTGGTGFIGSHLCQTLLERGDKVICLDNFNDYYNPQYKRENINPFKDNGRFVLVEADITDWQRLQSIFATYSSKLSAVIHLAARAGVRASLEEPLLFTSVNINGTNNLLELTKIHKIPKFVFASSSSVYGNQEKTPFSENDPVDRPISPYAATKKAGELMVYAYHHLYDIDTVCLRFFTVYGPQGRPDMAPYLFTDWIYHNKELIKYGDGSTRRDYTYIDDIIQGVVATLDRTFGYEIINLGNSQTITLNEFISIVEELLGKKAKIINKPIQPGDVKKTYADISKAKKLLNYQPTTSFARGMENFINWYKENRV